jgi:hypothetical protein
MALVMTVAGCGYAGETGDEYKHSLAAKPVWSALQQAEWNLRTAPKRAFVYNPDQAPDVDTIAIPAKDGSGYVVFTAKADEGRVLSMPADAAILLDKATIAELRRRHMISDAVATELARRSI